MVVAYAFEFTATEGLVGALLVRSCVPRWRFVRIQECVSPVGVVIDMAVGKKA